MTYMDLKTGTIKIEVQGSTKLQKRKFTDLDYVFRYFPFFRNKIILYLVIQGLIGCLAYYLVTEGIVKLAEITTSERLKNISKIEGYSKALYALIVGFLYNSIASAEFIPGFRYGSLRKIIEALFSEFDDLVENIIIKSKSNYFQKLGKKYNLNLRKLGTDVGKHILKLAGTDQTKIRKAQAFMEDLSTQTSVEEGLYLVHDQYGKNVIKILYP